MDQSYYKMSALCQNRIFSWTAWRIFKRDRIWKGLFSGWWISWLSRAKFTSQIRNKTWSQPSRLHQEPSGRFQVISGGINGFLDFAHSKGLETVSVNRRFETPTYLRKGTDSVSETLCSLEYRTMDKVQKPINHDCHIRIIVITLQNLLKEISDLAYFQTFLQLLSSTWLFWEWHKDIHFFRDTAYETD
jgi:hypothetical protein